MRIIPQLGPCHLRLMPGAWHCHSRFRQAINLQHASGTLLTLLAGGRDLGPMAWRLAPGDFRRLALRPGDALWADGQSLSGSGVTIAAPRRLCSLAARVLLPGGVPLVLQDHQGAAPLGLDGALARPGPLALNVCGQLRNCLDRWWQRQRQVDWRIIGLGQGLTPASDDMLVGVLAVLWSHPALRQYLDNVPLLPPATTLRTLTSVVSSGYLAAAGTGLFSLSIHRLLRRLAEGRPGGGAALDALLAHGHTSGADTVAGLMVAQRWLAARITGEAGV